MFSIAAALPLGISLGVLGGFLGTGGGTFAIPLLVLFASYDQKLAQGTALVMVVANLAYALIKYRQRGGVETKPAALIALSAIMTSGLSSYWALSLSSETLKTMYGAFLIALAGFVILSRGRKPAGVLGTNWIFVPGLLGGASLGFFGVGGAMLAVPILVMFYGYSQLKAQGLGLALALPGCIVSLYQYGQFGQVDWVVGAVLAGGGLLGVPAGVFLAHAAREKILIRSFCLLLVAAGTAVIAS